MSQTIDEPEAETTAAAVGPVAPLPGARTVRTTALVAFVAIVIALLGMVALTRPLKTPTQDCGTPISFLTRGKQNVFVDPSSPPKGITKAEAEANNDQPCQERAFNRALPAGIVVVAGTFVALIALVVEFVVRYRYGRAASMERWQTPTAPSP